MNDDRMPRGLLAMLLLATIIGGAVDLYFDAPANWRSVHVVYEVALIVALAGLGRAIDERFIAWGLTPAEREVTLLLLKGRSHKQIAFEDILLPDAHGG